MCTTCMPVEDRRVDGGGMGEVRELRKGEGGELGWYVKWKVFLNKKQHKKQQKIRQTEKRILEL